MVSKSLKQLDKLRRDIINKEIELLSSTPKNSNSWKKIVSEAWASDYYHNKLHNIHLYNKSEMLYLTYVESNQKKGYNEVTKPTYTKKQDTLAKHINKLESTVKQKNLTRAKSMLGRILTGIGNKRGTRLPSAFNTDKNEKIGIRYLSDAAKEGDPSAQYIMAVTGSTKDRELAVRYITQASKKNGQSLKQTIEALENYKDTSIYKEYLKFNFFWDNKSRVQTP